MYSFDFEYSKEIDMDKVWAQAYFNAFERKNYNPELTTTDIAENEKETKICTGFNGARTHFCTF